MKKITRVKMVLLPFVVLAVVCSITTQIWAAAWTTKAPIPTLMGGHIAETVDRKIYAGQGATPSGGNTNGIFYSYDPDSNQWTELDNHSDTYNRAGAVINGKIYAFGGVEHAGPLSKSEVYDPVSKTWSLLASMPTPRHSMRNKAGVVGGKAYAIGSGDWCKSYSNEVYDPVTNQWEVRSTVSPNQCNPAVVGVDDKIYVIGGMDGAVFPSQRIILDTVRIYDPATDTWASGSPMPQPRYTSAVVVLNGKILLMGGVTPGEGTTNSVIEYDPILDSWTEREPMPTPRASLAAAVVDGIVYAIAGNAATSSGYTGVVEAYDRSQDPTVGDVSISKTQELDFDRGSDPSMPFVYHGDTISYTISATNYFANDVNLMIFDDLSGYAEGYVDYLGGTVTDDVSGLEDSVNGSFLSGGWLDYLLVEGATMTLEFEVRVTDLAPLEWIFVNVAKLTAYFTDPSTPIIENKQSDPVYAQVKENPIPEPTTLLLVGFGLLGLFGIVGRRRKG